MKQHIKEKIKIEIKVRNARAYKIGTTELPYNHIQRLQYFLMKKCTVNKKESTVRKYLLTYDRVELRKILDSIRVIRKNTNFSVLNEGKKINLSFCFENI